MLTSERGVTVLSRDLLRTLFNTHFCSMVSVAGHRTRFFIDTFLYAPNMIHLVFVGGGGRFHCKSYHLLGCLTPRGRHLLGCFNAEMSSLFRLLGCFNAEMSPEGY